MTGAAWVHVLGVVLRSCCLSKRFDAPAVCRFDALADELVVLGKKQKQDKREIGLLRQASKVLMDRNRDYQIQVLFV